MDLVSLTFSPGPISANAPPAAGAPQAAKTPAVAGAPADTERPAEATHLIQAIREAEEDVRQEEVLNGPASPRLIDSLESLAELYRNLGEYRLALGALGRARQIIRTRDGLYSLSQVEVVESMIELLEEAGEYYESDSLQAEILELANRNPADPRVPMILAGVADRQMDAVREYFATDGWERSLERIDAKGSGWDVENLEFLRSFAGRKPLNRLDGAIRDMLTNGSYEIGDIIDARELLGQTYALVDAINDHNEAGQRRIDDGGILFGTKDIERDLALSAFRRARRLYSTALHRVLEFGDYGSGEFPAIEQKMIDTYYFELEHTELYPDGSADRGGDRGPDPRPLVYGTGTSVLEAQVVSLMSQGASAVEIAKALMEVGDWHLLFSANSRAMDMYRDAYDLLVREGVPAKTLTEVVSPATPVILAGLTSDACVAFDPTRAYPGFVDLSVEIGRFGQVTEAEVVNRSAGTSPTVEKRARTHVFETRFRPRFERGELRRSDAFTLRYYYDYGAPAVAGTGAATTGQAGLAPRPTSPNRCAHS